MPQDQLARQSQQNNSSNLAASYATLRKRVKEVLLLGQQRIDRERVRTYWETGRLINQHVKISSFDRPDYGKQVVMRLSRDLGIGEQVLYRCIRFAQNFPNLSGRTNLTWTHYRALLWVPDKKKRLQLAQETEKREWNSTELEQRIKNFHRSSRIERRRVQGRRHCRGPFQK